jgi:hypothetical protein
VLEEILSTNLPEGTYALTARADLTTDSLDIDFWFARCELRNGSTLLGGSQDDRSNVDAPEATLTVIGVVTVQAGGAEISLWCKNSGGIVGVLGTYGADLMVVKVGGTF